LSTSSDIYTPEQSEVEENDTDTEIAPPREERTEPSSGEVFRLSGEMVNMILVGIVFLLIGVVLGFNLRGSGGGIDAATLRAVVQEAVADAVGEQQSRNTMAGDGPAQGPEDAPVVMVEFSDFLCSFCGRHYENTLRPLLENYEGHIRYVYRDFPSVGGQNAVQSALAAHCADDQDRFWDYHGLLFSNQQSLMVSLSALDDVLVGFAEDLELDMVRFNTCLEDQTHMSKIIRSSSDAQSVGARGTPAFVINGTFISGAQDYQIFANLIDAELAAAGIEIDNGAG
jgi:protein-disulfide isomerase